MYFLKLMGIEKKRTHNTNIKSKYTIDYFPGICTIRWSITFSSLTNKAM